MQLKIKHDLNDMQEPPPPIVELNFYLVVCLFYFQIEYLGLIQCREG